MPAGCRMQPGRSLRTESASQLTTFSLLIQDEIPVNLPGNLTQTGRPPSLLAVIVRGCAVFAVAWVLLSIVLSVAIPTDPTGDPDTDKREQPQEWKIIAALLTGSAGITAIDLAQWRRQKRRQNQEPFARFPKTDS